MGNEEFARSCWVGAGRVEVDDEGDSEVWVWDWAV